MEPLTLTLQIVGKTLTRPLDVEWWEWATLGSVVLPIILILTGATHYFLWAVTLHFLLDFPLQTSETSGRKCKGEFWPLLYHSFIAGGLPGYWIGNLEGFVFCFLVHWGVDAANKFGIPGVKGGLLDQSLHVLTLVVLFIYVEGIF